MLARISQILAPPVFEDEEKTRSAGLLNIILWIILALVLLYTGISLFVVPNLATLGVEGVLIAVSLGLLFLMRRGQVHLASLLLTCALWALITMGIFYFGGVGGSGTFSYFGVILIAGLLLGGRAGLAFAGLTIVATGGLVYIEEQGLLPPPANPMTPAYLWISFSTTLVGVAGLLYLATRSLNDALRHAREERRAQREANAALQAARASLEERVAERTRDLAERTAELANMVAAQEQLLATVRQMAVPVVPIMAGIIVLPLVGAVDSQRADQVVQALLEGIETHRARLALLDITGVPVVDTAVAQVLLDAASAARLLGTEVVLVGIRPEVAQTIVGLGVDLSRMVTRADLQGGVEYAQHVLSRANV